MSNPYGDILSITSEKHDKPNKKRKISADDRDLTHAECKEPDNDTKPTDNIPLKNEEKNSQSRGEIDTIQTIQTLLRHMTNEKKSVKAIGLMTELIKAKLARDNALQFFEAIAEFFNWTGADITDKTTRVAAGSMVDQLKEKMEYFTCQQQFQIRTWNLLTCIRNDLQTDDTFVFSRACKTIHNEFYDPALFSQDQAIKEESTEDATTGDTDDSAVDRSNDHARRLSDIHRSRVDAVLRCMRTGFALYTRAEWSKQPLDYLFTQVSRKRLALDLDQREEVDELTTKITTVQRRISSGATQHTIRTYNSTAHPLTQKRVGILR